MSTPLHLRRASLRSSISSLDTLRFPLLSRQLKLQSELKGVTEALKGTGERLRKLEEEADEVESRIMDYELRQGTQGTQGSVVVKKENGVKIEKGGDFSATQDGDILTEDYTQQQLQQLLQQQRDFSGDDSLTARKVQEVADAEFAKEMAGEDQQEYRKQQQQWSLTETMTTTTTTATNGGNNGSNNNGSNNNGSNNNGSNNNGSNNNR